MTRETGGEQSLAPVIPLFGDAAFSRGSVSRDDDLFGALGFDQLFGGDSGANAGDTDVPTEPTEPVDPTQPTTPTEPTEPGTTDNAALQQALSDYQEALADRQAAYAANDLVAAAEADARMQDAVERAIAAIQ